MNRTSVGRLQVGFGIVLLTGMVILSNCGKNPQANNSEGTPKVRTVVDSGKVACIMGRKLVLANNQAALEANLTRYLLGSGPIGCPTANDYPKLGCFMANTYDLAGESNLKSKRTYDFNCTTNGVPNNGIVPFVSPFKTGADLDCNICNFDCNGGDELLVPGKPRVGCFKRRL